MALGTYDELKQAVASWLHRSDLAGVIPDLIRLAEARMSLDLEVPELEVTYGVLTDGSSFITPPTKIAAVQKIHLSGKRPLAYVELSQQFAQWPDNEGEPLSYSFSGDSVVLAPYPPADTPIQMTYRQAVPALSDTNFSNSILTRYPDVYLYGTLAQAQPFIMDDARIGLYKNLYQEAVEAANRQMSRMPGQMAVRHM